MWQKCCKCNASVNFPDGRFATCPHCEAKLILLNDTVYVMEVGNGRQLASGEVTHVQCTAPD